MAIEKSVLRLSPDVLAATQDPLTATADIIVGQLEGLMDQGDSKNAAVTTAILDATLQRRPPSPGHKETLPVILASHQPKDQHNDEAHDTFLCALRNLVPHLSVETAQQLLQPYVNGTYPDYDRDIAYILARIDSQFATNQLNILLAKALKNIGSYFVMDFYVPDAIFIIHALGTKQEFGALEPLQQAFSSAETILQCEMNIKIEDPEDLYERSNVSDRIEAYQPVVEAILDTCVAHPTQATNTFLLNTFRHAKAFASDNKSFDNYAHWLYATVGQRIIQAPFSSSDVVFQTLSADMEAPNGFIAREACTLLTSTAESSIQTHMRNVMLYTELDKATRRFVFAAAAIIHTKDKPQDIAVIINARNFSNDPYIAPAAEAVLEFYEAKKAERSLSTPTSKLARRANFFELPDVAIAWKLVKIKSPVV